MCVFKDGRSMRSGLFDVACAVLVMLILILLMILDSRFRGNDVAQSP